MQMLRRIFRRMLTALSAVSFLLLLVLIVLWVRSEFVATGWSLYYNRWRPAPEQRMRAIRFMLRVESSEGEATAGFTWSIRPPVLVKKLSPKEQLPSTKTRWFRTPPRDLRNDFATTATVNAAGFYCRRSRGGTRQLSTGYECSDTLYSAAAPYWAISASQACLPLLWLGVSRRRRTQPAHHCRYCGYDLRTSPVRCPECGRAVEPIGAVA